MSVHDLTKPTDSEVHEYWRAYGEVIAAARAGYHKPYSNLHDEAGLWDAYDLGFHDALQRLARARIATEQVPA